MRRRRVSLLAAAVLTAAFLCAPSGPAAADPPAGHAAQWRALAAAALAKFETYDLTATGGSPGPTTTAIGCTPATNVPRWVSVYAWAAEASGRLRGWTDPRTTAYLNKMLSMKNPDGGYGMPCPWDQFGGNTVNPANTSYTVISAGHVGQTEIQAYKAGVLPASELQQLAGRVRSMPQLNNPKGSCLAATPAAADQNPAYCVHNMSAGAAVFLMQVAALGLAPAGSNDLAAAISRRETATYSVYTHSWPYDDQGRTSDDGHTAYLIASMYYLSPQLGNMTAQWMVDKTFTVADWGVTIGLAALPSKVAGMDYGPPDRWCEAGARSLPIQQQAEASWNTADLAITMAQAAELFSVAADACAPFDPPPAPATASAATTSPTTTPATEVPTAPTTPSG